MVSYICGIASQGTLQTMKRNMFHSENKFAKQDANCQNHNVSLQFTLELVYSNKLALAQTVHSDTKH